MGCVDTKEKNPLSTLKFECNELMSQNILCLQTIQYLLIKKRNLCQALRVISLQKKTESYYSIIVQYRNYWLYQAKKDSNPEINQNQYFSCIKEQQKELLELKDTHSHLLYIIEDLMPGWKTTFRSVKDLKDSLEASKSVVEETSSLYGSFYTNDSKQLKIAALQYSQNISDFDSKLYKDIKEVTVKKYKTPTKRVYFTDRIFCKPLKLEKKKTESKIEFEKEDIMNSLKSFEMNPNSQVEGILENLPASQGLLDMVLEDLPETRRSDFESESEQSEPSFPGRSTKNALSSEFP